MKLTYVPWILGLLASSTIACGDDDGTGGGGAGGDATTTTTTTTSGTSTSAATTTTTSSSSASSTSASASTGQGGGTLSDITATITDAQMFANCQPVVGPDPIGGSFDADYVNAGDAPGTLTVMGVGMQLTQDNMMLDWIFEITPDAIGPVDPMSTESVTHTKVNGSGSGTGGMPCDYCGAPGILYVDYQDDQGRPATATFAIEGLGCVQ